jgi:hypothetical protein
MRQFMVLTVALLMTACSSTGSESETSSTTAAGGADPGAGGAGGSGGGGGSASTGGAATTSVTTSSTGDVVAGPGCPDMRGVFMCPPWGNQPAYTLTIAQTFDGEVTTYQYTTFEDRTSSLAASAEGVTEGDHTGKCLPYEGTDALAYIPGDPTQATYNFINPDGDCQSDVDGVVEIICIRWR